MTEATPARTGRVRKPRSVRSTLGLIVLACEFLIVILAALVLFGLKSLPPAAALGGGAGVLVLIVIAAAASRSTIGIALGWVVQVILVLCVRFDIAVGVIGVLFFVFWTYCMIVGGRIDRREAAAADR